MSPAGQLVLDGLADVLATAEGKRAVRALLVDAGLLDQLAAPVEPAPLAYTARTLAVQLGVTDRTIRKAIDRGELTASKRLGRWVIDADEARAWIAEGRQVRRAITRPMARCGPVSGGLGAAFGLDDS